MSCVVSLAPSQKGINPKMKSLWKGHLSPIFHFKSSLLSHLWGNALPKHLSSRLHHMSCSCQTCWGSSCTSWTGPTPRRPAAWTPPRTSCWCSAARCPQSGSMGRNGKALRICRCGWRRTWFVSFARSSLCYSVLLYLWSADRRIHSPFKPLNNNHVSSSHVPRHTHWQWMRW